MKITLDHVEREIELYRKKVFTCPKDRQRAVSKLWIDFNTSRGHNDTDRVTKIIKTLNEITYENTRN